ATINQVAMRNLQTYGMAVECIIKWIAKKGALGGIARSQYIKFKRAQKENTNLTENEICQTLFTSRFSAIKLRENERERFERYLESNDVPTTLRDVCQAIADIELDIHSFGTKHAILAVGVLYEELERLGYQKE
ncbi:hypothetical protein ACFL3G_13420, partial [Planctomycetota bacterium]